MSSTRTLSAVFAFFLGVSACFAQATKPPSRVDHAVELLQQNRIQEARAELEAVLDANPSDTQAAAYLVSAEIQAGETERAVARARRLVEAEPDNTDFHMLLAQASSANSDWAQAEKEWRFVTEHRPGSESAHFELARVLLQTARFDEGLNEVNRSLEVNPNRTDARALKGNLLAAMGRMDAAVREWNAVIGVDPNNPAALSGLAVFFKDRAPDIALQYASRAVELTNWQSIGSIRVLALIYRSRGDTAKAREVLQKAVQKFPDSGVLAAELNALGPAPASAGKQQTDPPLGDVARKYRDQKKAAQQPPAAKKQQ